MSNEYKKWEKFSAIGSIYNESEASQNSHLEKRRMRQSDHTQVMHAYMVYLNYGKVNNVSGVECTVSVVLFDKKSSQ